MPTYKEYEASAVDIIRSSKDDFGDDLYALTSFGNESALLLNLLRTSGVKVPVLTIDTGFWFKETHEYQRTLEKQLGFYALKYRQNGGKIAYIQKTELWKTDLDEYNRLTKLAPLSKAIGELGVKALLSGVRSHQNDNRADMSTYGVGNDNEWRIHPVIDWPEAAVDDYFADHNLPRHPLYYQGYGSIGDWTITTPGPGRSGRNLGVKSECGLHVPVSERVSV